MDCGRLTILLLAAFFPCIPVGCSGGKGQAMETEEPKDTVVVPVQVEPEEPAPNPKDTVKVPYNYPSSITTGYFKEDLPGGKFTNGWYAVADMEAADAPSFNTIYITGKTVAQVHDRFLHAGYKPYIVINAGYFTGTDSVSPLVHGGRVRCRGYGYTRDMGGGHIAYPVRATFGQNEDKTFTATWTYFPSDQDTRLFSYPSPLDNDESTDTYMAAPPTSDVEGAWWWKPCEAVGGGPMLVKDGKNVADEYYWREVLDCGGTAGMSRQPRTAVGSTQDGKLILLVVDGRGMQGSAGFTVSELADKLIGLGAYQAINLDGGGSSTFVDKDGECLNWPSDSGSGSVKVLRRVATVILLSDQYIDY